MLFAGEKRKGKHHSTSMITFRESMITEESSMITHGVSMITFHTSMITQPNSTVIQTILSLFIFYKVLAVSLLPRFLKAIQSKHPFNGVTVVYSNKVSDLMVRHRLAK